MSQTIKNLPTVQETWVQSLDFGKIPWRRKWQPTSLFLPEKSLGQRSLAGYSPLVHNESGTTEQWNAPTHSVQFSSGHSVMSDSLPSSGLQHARHPCPSPTPGALKLLSITLEMPSNHLIVCHPLLLPPSVFPSIRVFFSESVHQVARVLEFQLQHQSFQWIFRTDFL